MIEPYARLRMRVEDIDITAIWAIMDLLGASTEDDRIAMTLAAVPKDFNSAKKRDTVTWDDLPDSLAPAQQQMASEYHDVD